ncbi:hypothetical protein A2331_06665 [Candidatus Falkowbacteria bacterium RIFOXYB2_FULL_34_18]|uniref:Uncharacterized protein n=1 Tax=Candidatus Falkowbacteria bacterium RIFOXYD2_FULL_34_120 TaxID=1798007 RepID=A0A1F5TRT1_9BACT|nr:MAG: hypothetical protein A2331_06665 [Candidatus Falkowbacteria bacterium RIFOXYB2_FULL_34_18]OGF29997.1 MAG: hypothetical protein A2500_04015 [Candidatus Falkowbacteria bacterium RIFOXYC12_FULL_34_55]OGF37146.1 MAG: hypothetical protein A2466_02505 [Candidatus Falkowbacteria bacterium RIFOXYC2_FULL_34_220]OGF39533.1 MAG: hypothetical protein A2515_04380 [Candidatus Falkowbacteria bacterium RIFOXYD12_FULL_34_57]OGF41484.1 MAG: hypothetical protein A2531_02220 [Candidatus Falkowbacteria bact
MSNNDQEFDEEEAADRLQQEKNKSQSALKEVVADVATAPVRIGTSNLLRSAWLSFFSVVGFIFIGLPYINLHAFGHFIMPSFFANLGEEWVPGSVKQFAGSLGQGSIWLTIIEWIALIVLDIAVLIIIIVSLMTIFIIFDIAHGWFGFFLDIYLKLKGAVS